MFRYPHSNTVITKIDAISKGAITKKLEKISGMSFQGKKDTWDAFIAARDALHPLGTISESDWISRWQAAHKEMEDVLSLYQVTRYAKMGVLRSRKGDRGEVVCKKDVELLKMVLKAADELRDVGVLETTKDHNGKNIIIVHSLEDNMKKKALQDKMSDALKDFLTHPFTKEFIKQAEAGK